MYNNTGADIEVTSADTVNAQVHYHIPANSAVAIQCPTVLTIKHAAGNWVYDLKPRPLRIDRKGNFLKRGKGWALAVDFQIQSDGLIYILPVNVIPPTAELPAQPQGYPIRPD